MSHSCPLVPRLPSGSRALLRAAPWLALLLLPACKTAEALAQRCAHGDATACGDACDKNVYGEGGCFQAGQAAYREAGTDFEGPEWRRAKNLFEKSCTGGHADGCLFAAQTIEVPFSAPRKAQSSATEWPVIDDKSIEARARFLDKACKSGSSKACERLGEVSIGKKPEVARPAYARACERGARAAECVEAREREVTAFEHYRDACRREVADACTALGDLVIRVDFPRAVRIFVAEAELRGVAESVGGLQPFIERRIDEARRAPVTDPTQPVRPTPVPENITVDFAPPTVSGRLAISFVQRALGDATSRLATCAGGKPLASEQHFTAKLVVDRTGDVWTALVDSVDAPAEVRSCVAGVLQTLVMQSPVGGIADVEQLFVIRPVLAEPITPPSRRAP